MAPPNGDLNGNMNPSQDVQAALIQAEISSDGPSQFSATTVTNGHNSTELKENDASHQAEDNEEGDELGQEVDIEHVSAAKKKKKKSRPKSKRGQSAPNGFEEYYADGPATPEQFEEEQSLYAKDIPFINRILTSIQRFERTRRLSPSRRDIFYKYLAYGGIDVGPNMFQSVTPLDKKTMSKEELATALSQLSINTETHDVDSPNALYTVDFLGCMKAFLSRRAVFLYGLETREQTVEVTSTLERYMDYLLQHDVCPEYKTQILLTRNFCREAHLELCSCADLGRQLPGDFNIACSTIFGGMYSTYDGSTVWGSTSTAGEYNFVGFTKEVALQIINFAMAGSAPDHIFEKYNNLITTPDTGLEVVRTVESTGLEITRIIPPSAECLALYRSDSRDFRPVGIVAAKPWFNPDAPPEDLSPEEQKASANTQISIPPKPKVEYTLLFEAPLILNFRLGMKLEATIHTLNCGISFIDEFQRVYPSFDNWICNELMIGYTKPRWLKGSVPYEEEQEHIRATEEAERARADAEANKGSANGLMAENEVQADSEAKETM